MTCEHARDACDGMGWSLEPGAVFGVWAGVQTFGVAIWARLGCWDSATVEKFRWFASGNHKCGFTEKRWRWNHFHKERSFYDNGIFVKISGRSCFCKCLSEFTGRPVLCFKRAEKSCCSPASMRIAWSCLKEEIAFPGGFARRQKNEPELWIKTVPKRSRQWLSCLSMMKHELWNLKRQISPSMRSYIQSSIVGPRQRLYVTCRGWSATATPVSTPIVQRASQCQYIDRIRSKQPLSRKLSSINQVRL